MWSDILSQGHNKTAAMWLEYIQWERFVKLIVIVFQTEDPLMFHIHLYAHKLTFTLPSHPEIFGYLAVL